MSGEPAAAPPPSEWQEGWRIVLACALASGTGVVLLFFTISLFLLPLAEELNVSRGELGAIQALIITAALGSPVIGRMTDRFGFRPVFYACTAAVVAIELGVALFVASLPALAISIALIGFFGVGSTAVAVTRPVSAHFRQYRGTALGLVAVGVSVTTMIVPPLLQWVIDTWTWRAGFVALAGLSVAVGVPAVALLLPAGAARGQGGGRQSANPGDRSFLRSGDFWLMAASNMAMSMATAGAISQMSPMIQEEGIAAGTAALALSLYAAGQFAGRLGGGWLLDRFEPRRVAVLLTILPGTGFLLLYGAEGLVPAALFAATMIGLQQGAELDIFAYFTARRFPVERYGTIYGALIGLGWIGNALGIVGIGLLHDRFGSYDAAQLIGAFALLVGALLLVPLRLQPRP